VRIHLLAVFALSCARTPKPVVPVADAPLAQPADREQHYTVWLGGARVGSIIEQERWSRAGVVLSRTETMRFLRGDAPVSLVTKIEVTADHALVPSRVSWIELGSTRREAVAVHDAQGWRLETYASSTGLDLPQLAMPADAIPAELVSLLTRRDGRFAGHVFLVARGFLAGEGRIEPAAPGRLVARLAFTGSVAEATIDVDADGSYARIVDGQGVIARRTTATQAIEPFEPVDLVAATSIPIAGHGKHLVIDGDIALPPVPGQAAHPVSGGLELALSPQLPGGLPDETAGPDRKAEIRALVVAVRASIVPDLGAGPTTAEQAAHASAGDCTTFALAYAAHAAKRSIPTRVVTGLRVDGDRLVRHRWAVSWTGSAWIAVDAAFGAAPAGGDLIGLVVHDADDAGLVAGEAALTSVRTATRR
jgi:Transglutaminase-like superfamily